ncbi:(2Fe-2S) ferredoxin domain-containing protein [Aquimarina sp. TRL1]|uniref:(2Fe-2S) ferredoxin domain-containing protein n=1 Tax=Aquimarina sp. (strain TRL1) TaxID=2736252 RepID=UPI00158D4297|nr:(2Fe-2S) ferredoxin domain-containing protein [Aquimarina sp. TRL1]QKX07077.1 (2Fe-2S) ferredoxin domain-containing protein [Aquimarina sp. TRL1]
MGKNLTNVKTTFQFCDGGSCQRANSEIAIREARAYLRNEGAWDDIHTIKTRCNGRCENAPTWIVQPGNFWYKNLSPEKAIDIVSCHLNNTPEKVEEHLLYKEGWDTIKTDKERKVTLTSFTHKTDPHLGDALIAKAFASDQHLYPLFQYLFQKDKKIAIELNDGMFFDIKTPHVISYHEKYDLSITGDQINIKLAIAGIPKDADDNLVERKVTSAEVIWLKKTAIFTKAIRLKNKKGNHLVTCWIKEEDIASWHHILSIYLGMNPEHIRIKNEP